MADRPQQAGPTHTEPSHRPRMMGVYEGAAPTRRRPSQVLGAVAVALLIILLLIWLV